MSSFLFDVTMVAAIRIEAETEERAREILYSLQDASTAYIGDNLTGNQAKAEVSFEGTEAVLVEVDGEEVDPPDVPEKVTITWVAEDIKTLVKDEHGQDLTDNQAECLLHDVAKALKDRSIELGWEVISTLISDEDVEKVMREEQ